jgi:hypothetical protein
MMRDRLALTITLLEDDTPQAADILSVATDVLPSIAEAVGEAVAGPIGAAIGAATGPVLSASRDSWQGDVLGVHTNVLRRTEDWGVDRNVANIERADGHIKVSYAIRRVHVPRDLKVRVRIDKIDIPSDLDDDFWFLTDSSDVYIVSRVWGGKFVGQIPDHHMKRIPSGGYRRINSRQSWSLNQTIFEGPIGPFLSLDVGVWDQDDTSDDDMHGTIFGLWLMPDLYEAFRRSGWHPLEFVNVSRGRHLRISFTIEPLDPLKLPLYTWYSPSRGDYFTTTHPTWRASGRSDRRSPDYRSIGFQGDVFNPDLPQPPGTVPLYSWWNPGRGDNFLTSDPRWAGAVGTQNDGYRLFRHEGYIFDPRRPQPPRTRPLYSWWNGDKADNFATAQVDWRGDIGDWKEGYRLYRLEGYIVGDDII